MVRHAALSCALLVGIFPTSASATVLVEVPIDDMVWDADAIVLGEVVRVATRVEVQNERPEPWTVATVRVDRWLSGGDGSREILVEERGGEWAGGGMRIAGTPEYAVGERVLVFLWRDRDGRMRTYGMVQGKFVVRSGIDVPTTVERDLSDVGFAEWQGQRMTIVEGEPAVIALDAMLLRIATVLAARSPAVRTPARTVR